MASIGFLIGGALVNALAFTGGNYLFSSLSKESIDQEPPGGGAFRSFSYWYMLTWCSNPTLSKIFRHTKILPCLKYWYEKHTLSKISA